jgi:hypothetical protein
MGSFHLSRSLRFASASSHASASDTSGKGPSSIARSRPFNLNRNRTVGVPGDLPVHLAWRDLKPEVLAAR